jgi:RNA-binding protein
MTDVPKTPPPAPSLTTRERAHLKARAHGLEPVVRVGHAGLTDAALASIDRALQAHELIKVRMGEGDREERAAISASIAARTGAAVVQRVGRVLVLWRPSPVEGDPAP